jgi:hypothetical protein
MKTYTLNQVQDKLIGKVGTPARDKFEYDLQIELIGNAIKQTRKERKPPKEKRQHTSKHVRAVTERVLKEKAQVKPKK